MIKIDFKPPDKQLREFGYFALAGFPIIGAIVTQKFGAPPVVGTILLALGAFMGLAAAFSLRQALMPVYVAMMCLAIPIGFVISNLLLGLIYYGLFTPVGLLFRVTGRDPLQRKIDPQADSYWTVRETPRAAPSYLRLY